MIKESNEMAEAFVKEMELEKIKRLAYSLESLQGFKFKNEDKEVKFEGGRLYSTNDSAAYLAQKLNRAIARIREEVEEELRAQLVLCAKVKG